MENFVNILKKEKGFTIIEVVLVLAIAGLIFMMVFLALPALQRSQRDTQRKQDLSRAMMAINNYTSSNRGSLPTLDSNFVKSYLSVGGDTFIDPSGANTVATPDAKTYTFTVSSSKTTPVLPASFDSKDTQNVIYYTTSAVCGAGGGDTVADGTRKIALRMYLEGGGVACQNN